MGARCSTPEPHQAEHIKATFETRCALAAQAVCKCDILVLVTGAGFSADSGLAVYSDVAKVGAYQRLGLEYRDICQPHWLRVDSDLFYGFWGQCFNDYRMTQPHEGYSIVARWRDVKNAALIANEMKMVQEAMRGSEAQEQVVKDPYVVDGRAGAFFTFTSNVDAHSFDVFQANEIRECHGNVELWQCGHSFCGGQGSIWRAPLRHRFVVDTETMRAPETISPQLVASLKCETLSRDRKGRQEDARVGHTFGGSRRHTLKHMIGRDDAGWVCDHSTENRPQCPICGGAARPAILMFGDLDWKDNEAQGLRWELWKDALYTICEERQEVKPLKVCVVEVGCGDNVTTCRNQSEDIAEELHNRGGDVKLIRINPDFPLADEDSVAENVISIMARGLETLKRIDHYCEW